MAATDAVFAADGAHLGRITDLSDEWLSVRDDEGHTFRFPRSTMAVEHEGHIFLNLPDRASARRWRTDVQSAQGLRSWWERNVLLGSAHPLDGHLHD